MGSEKHEKVIILRVKMEMKKASKIESFLGGGEGGGKGVGGSRLSPIKRIMANVRHLSYSPWP